MPQIEEEYAAVPTELTTIEPERESCRTVNAQTKPVVSRRPRELTAAYTSEVDVISEQEWYEQLRQFDDANIYQTWAYGAVVWGSQNTSHLVLKREGKVVALAQARIIRIPLVNIGIAYVRWGPVLRSPASDTNEVVFRQAVRALRNEFTCRRKLVLRLFPALFHEEHEQYLRILEEEGFSPRVEASPSQTILMSLERPLEELREGMAAHWQRELKAAERKQVESRESVEDAEFGEFIEIYKEMVSRKQFVEPNDINQFRSIQELLPEDLKMRILLGKLGEDTAAGMIYSAIGDTAVYLFGATSNTGMKAKGSYLLQWKVLEALKQSRTATYNLHGINKARNPGTYKFKSDFGGSNGREVSFIGRFESQPSAMTSFCIKTAEDMLSRARSARKRWANRRVAEKAGPQEK